MRVIGKNGKVYWTNNKETYNAWRKKNRQLRKELGRCQDCPKPANVSSFDHNILISRCRSCALKQARMKKRRADDSKCNQDVRQAQGTTHQEESGLHR